MTELTTPSPAPEQATSDSAPETTFRDLGLPATLLEAVEGLGFVTPSAIQAAAIPPLLAGRDITGVAQTGTGKTAAFGLPLLSRVDPDLHKTQALVLTPTRELALQVAEAIESFASALTGVEVLAVYGGAPYLPQQRALQRGAQVVVGTPGRVIDHLERKNLVLDDVRFLALDEADEMLRMGFAEDVDTIFGAAPAERQVALFSATMPAPIRRVAQQHLNDPVEIAVSRQASTVTTVHQTYAIVPFRHKAGSLVRVLQTSDADAAIVFCRTRGAAEDVGTALVERGIAAATISGDVAQKDREKIVERLRSGQIDVLVATDVAARGLDVDRIGLVVNFDLPGEPEAYVHRIGRTGRAGRTGEALSFVTPHERGRLRQIERTTRTPLEEISIPTPADVSAHRVRRMLDDVADRHEAGRLDLYVRLVREHLAAHPDLDAVELAGTLAALFVGDKGPKSREAIEAENEAAELAAASRAVRQRREVEDGARPRRGHGHDDDRGGRRRDGRPDRRPGGAREDDGRPARRLANGTRYRVAVGHTHGVEPRGIVGALANEGGLSGKDVGKIDIFGSFSLVEIGRPLDAATLDRIGRARVGGRLLRIAVDKGAPAGARRKRD
ncbi:DEAD/DEAH box helicase [Luteimicrobium xylanilyticum]|uniref:RNA helicase n=1 Tax=Luteimicrobium xylanilyticum TaxID=1133546 RepID=A0A5P9QA65_9MICO|nr:DEAD/DEAH box helicase [Luteimicrobium xylanilyticum]QFU98317.1 RNA helicase [Luteimicrobium xylanilyticum]